MQLSRQFARIFDDNPEEKDAALEYVQARSQAATEALTQAGPREPLANGTNEVVAATSPTAAQREPSVQYVPPPWKARKDALDVFTSLQSWQGVVQEIDNDTIHVRLFDLKDAREPELVTSFPASELDEEDRALLVVGGVFYWNVGYSHTASGIRRQSLIRFRRLPMWTKKELAEATRLGAQLYEMLGDKDGDDRPG